MQSVTCLGQEHRSEEQFATSIPVPGHLAAVDRPMPGLNSEGHGHLIASFSEQRSMVSFLVSNCSQRESSFHFWV